MLNFFTGYGVISRKKINTGEFVVQYKGTLIESKAQHFDLNIRYAAEGKGSYILEFRHNDHFFA